MTHTITDPPHRLAPAYNADFVAWIKTAHGFYVKLEIGGNATQEQADKFVRETAAAPELLEALTDALHCISLCSSADEFPEIAKAHAAIAKATGAAS